MFIHENGFYWDTPLVAKTLATSSTLSTLNARWRKAALFGQRYTFRRVRKRKEFQLISLSQFQVEFEGSLLFRVNLTDHLQSKRVHVERFDF